jgi:hypothetical protein
MNMGMRYLESDDCNTYALTWNDTLNTQRYPL